MTLKPVETEIINHENLADGIFLLRLRFLDGEPSNFTPGQFIMVRVSDSFDPLLNRPFSIANFNKKERHLTIIYRIQGKGTTFLSNKRPNETVKLIGPLGRGFPNLQNVHCQLLLVAGGMGIAPLLSLIPVLNHQNIPFRLLWGIKHSTERIDLNEIDPDEFKKTPVYTITEDETSGQKGTVLDLLESFSNHYTQDPVMVFSCGPMKMLEQVHKKCLKRKWPLFVSLETRMACGIGVCQGCALPSRKGGYLKVCQDGPVFDAQSLDWRKIHAPG